MTPERITEKPIQAAQIFFDNLYREMSGGPLADDIETARLVLEVNRHLSKLVAGGLEQPNGSTEAVYEFLSNVSFVSVVNGELIIKDEEAVPQICRILYKEDGFTTDDSVDPVKWIVGLEMVGLSSSKIYSTITGQVGHYDENTFDLEHEYSRGLVIVGNNLPLAFSQKVLIQRLS